MAELEGQVAVVTGGGQGIGRAIPLRLAAAGASIGVIDINARLARWTRPISVPQRGGPTRKLTSR